MKPEVQVNQHTSCGYHRLLLPFSQLRADLKVPVFVFNRLPIAGPRWLERKRADGFKIVMDLDDHWELSEGHYLAPAYRALMTGTRIRMSLERADVVWVTTSRLASEVARINPRVVVVPNALPFDTGQFRPVAAPPNTTFVYAAGPSHLADVQACAPVLDAADVTLAGVQRGNVEWESMAGALPRARCREALPVGAYMQAYAGHRVALAPLLDNQFNACKSNLKTLEAGAYNLPLIASRVLPYDNPLDREHVTLAGSVEDWQRQMERFRKDPGMAQERGLQLGAHVRAHYQLRAANEIRRQVLESFR